MSTSPKNVLWKEVSKIIIELNSNFEMTSSVCACFFTMFVPKNVSCSIAELVSTLTTNLACVALLHGDLHI